MITDPTIFYLDEFGANKRKRKQWRWLLGSFAAVLLVFGSYERVRTTKARLTEAARQHGVPIT